MLAGLYTESTAYSLVGKVAQGLSSLGVGSRRLRAVSARTLHGIPQEKVFSTDRAFFSEITRGMISSDLSSIYRRWGLQGADWVYSMYGEDPVFLQWAKEQGARIMVDVFVHPDTVRIVERDRLQFMGRDDMDVAEIERQDAHSKLVFELAELLLCPSGWVADGIREMFPDQAHKVRVIPYGSSLQPSESINPSPVVGRVLFAGRDTLRKGVHYLAEAAHLARKVNPSIEVRMAGLDASDLAGIEHRSEVHCIGTIQLHQMKEEFRQADVLVLPSLSEGQAGVVLEAMACGCPVIATRESGVDFEPSCGVTVPVRDAAALAAALCDVVGDREKRDQLAQGALRQSQAFTMEAWKRRLVDVVTEAQSI